MKRSILWLLILLELPLHAGGQEARHCDTKPPTVINGTNGKDGINGSNGSNGLNGSNGDSDAGSSHAFVGGEVVWHEWDSNVSVRSGYKHDVIHGGEYGDIAVIQYRFGKSSAERRVEALEKQLNDLTSALTAASDRKKVIVNGTR